MEIDRTSLAPGMRVLDAHGMDVGRVKEVRPNAFVLDRPLAPDVSLSYQHVRRIESNSVQLDLDANQIDDESWREGPPAPQPDQTS